MNAFIYSAQVCARRTVPSWCGAPRGTPSRLVQLRLDRCFHRYNALRLDQHAPPQHRRFEAKPLVSTSSANKLGGASEPVAREDTPRCILSRDELDLLYQVLDAPLHYLPSDPSAQERDNSLWLRREPEFERVPKEVEALEHKWAERELLEDKHTEGRVTATAPDETETFTRISPEAIRDGLRQPTLATALLEQLLQEALGKNTRKNAQTLVNLSPSTFSELLRCLDPIEIMSKEVDPTAGMRLSPAMARQTALGQRLDVFGVRKIYVILLRKLLAAAYLRLDAGRSLLRSDYVILLRYAGAASDPITATAIWSMILQHANFLANDGGMYAEFLKARYLTHPLYTQYDPTRLRVQALNLRGGRIGIRKRLGGEAVWQLRRRGRARLFYQAHRFGQNRHKPEHVERTTRAMKTRRRLIRAYERILDDQFAPSEDLLCAILVGLGRTGSLTTIRSIIARFWNLDIRTGPGGFSVTPLSPGFKPSAESLFYPTERLLEAAVEALCTQSELNIAVKLVDYISRYYNIAVSDRIWRQLLSWSYALCHGDVWHDWKALGLHYKLIDSSSVQTIWNVMVSPPYSVQPRITDHDVLIRSLILSGKFEEAIHHMLELMPYYKQTLTELENNFYKYIPLHRLEVELPHVRKEWLGAQARKDQAWFYLHSWCSFLLQRIRPRDSDDDMAVRMIPHLVDAFRPVLPQGLRYSLSTGIVEITNAQPIQRYKAVEGRVNQPAWVTSDLVSRTPRSRVTPRESEGLDDLPHWQPPALSFEERMERKRQTGRSGMRRRAIDVRLDPGEFLERRPSLSVFQRRFT